ncbi:Uncharacterised protein [Salmonella enterica subsp. enterica serovar Bovismorbificans]|uniref:Uncharacterized protein n=1 Tax=Salmonella enterica subsp. enterica serovar Bovismorbificans TaxID=58097 RepID=A0A655DYA6_SALET|nr:Uncharacterised protein [Salmonella enterica subsp. enterica serovar Bovismorbificans]
MVSCCPSIPCVFSSLRIIPASMACSRTPLTCATLSSPVFTAATKSPASRA